MMRVTTLALTLAVAAASAQLAQAQARGAQPPAPPPTPKASAPFDLTGTWVSVITEDWRWRMVTPPKGDYASIPINAEARKVADSWDPAADEKSGSACKVYGAPGLMRLPGRLRISWQDDSTLKLETDAGIQTRLFHFGDWKSPGGDQTRQGDSVAAWEMPAARAGEPAPKFGNLRTITTRLQPGYLRRNGIPYSDKTTLTEYWDLLRHPGGDQWLVVTTIVDDPTYLARTWITSLNFKKEPDAAKWDPAPCTAK